MRAAMNGMGRIGRAAFKILIESGDLEVVAVNDLADPEALAYMIQYDTVYGRYEKKVSSGSGSISVDGHDIKVLSVKEPENLPWSDMDIDVVFECTGKFTTSEDLKKHLSAGAKKVVLSAPAKSEDIGTFIHGVTQPGVEEDIISCASCTTNAVAPAMEIMGRRIGIKKASLNTVHAYTSSQNIVDGPHKNLRRGRAGALNFVPTSTGAAKATAKALPEYKGRFDGVAIRGPVAAGSVADIVFISERPTTREEVNGIFAEESSTERYREVMGVTESAFVSSDVIMDPRASIMDAGMTQVIDGDLVRIMCWYDNEWGYAAQMIREAVSVLGAEKPVHAG